METTKEIAARVAKHSASCTEMAATVRRLTNELKKAQADHSAELEILRFMAAQLAHRVLLEPKVSAVYRGNSLNRVFEDHDGRLQQVAEQARPWDLSPEERAEETEAKRRAEGKTMDSFHADDFKKTTVVFGPGSSELAEAYVHSQQEDKAGPVAGAVDRRWWANLTDKELDIMLSFQKTLLAQGGDERSAFACVVNSMLLARRDELGGNDSLRPLTDGEFSSCFNAFTTVIDECNDQWRAALAAVVRILAIRRGEKS